MLFSDTAYAQSDSVDSQDNGSGNNQKRKVVTTSPLLLQSYNMILFSISEQTESENAVAEFKDNGENVYMKYLKGNYFILTKDKCSLKNWIDK